MREVGQLDGKDPTKRAGGFLLPIMGDLAPVEPAVSRACPQQCCILPPTPRSREASETASELLSPDKDSLAVLESHLLSQQQKLQKYMDSLATTIQAGIPGQVLLCMGRASGCWAAAPSERGGLDARAVVAWWLNCRLCLHLRACKLGRIWVAYFPTRTPYTTPPLTFTLPRSVC